MDIVFQSWNHMLCKRFPTNSCRPASKDNCVQRTLVHHCREEMLQLQRLSNYKYTPEKGVRRGGLPMAKTTNGCSEEASRKTFALIAVSSIMYVCAVFEQPEDPSTRSFFSEIIASISDVKFSHSGRYILSRDYLTVKVYSICTQATLCNHRVKMHAVAIWSVPCYNET